MGPIVIIVVIGVIALAGLAALIYFLGRGAGPERSRVTWLAVGFVVASFLSVVALNLVSVLYEIPPLLIAGIAVVVALLVGLFVLIGRAVSWRAGKVVALVGVLITSYILFAAIAMSGIGGDDLMQPLYRTTIKQMADDMGFVALLPANEPLITDMLPVTEIPEPDRGIGLAFGEFQIDERKAGESTSESDLEALVAPGEEPVGGFRIASKFQSQEDRVVQGEPAVAVSYVETAPPGRATVLVFVLDGVEVRMASMGYERLTDGEWVTHPALTIDELVAIADTLEPVE